MDRDTKILIGAAVGFVIAYKTIEWTRKGIMKSLKEQDLPSGTTDSRGKTPPFIPEKIITPQTPIHHTYGLENGFDFYKQFGKKGEVDIDKWNFANTDPVLASATPEAPLVNVILNTDPILPI